jgi:hypothetical protein
LVRRAGPELFASEEEEEARRVLDVLADDSFRNRFGLPSSH